MARPLRPLLLACTGTLLASAAIHTAPDWAPQWTELRHHLPWASAQTAPATPAPTTALSPAPADAASPARQEALDFQAGDCVSSCTLLLAGVTPTYLKAPVWPYPAAPEDYRGLTDTLVLVHLQPGQAPEVLSIPRDTWLSRPGLGEGRINEANTLGGPEALAQSVQTLTGVRPDHLVMLNTRAVRGIVDALGGVEIEVEQTMQYEDRAGGLSINLQPGHQRLSGEQAEGYLRWRKDGKGDIGRAERQQHFVRAVAQTMADPREWWRAGQIKAALEANAKTSLTQGDMIALLKLLPGIGTRLKDARTTLLPGQYGGAGEWVPDLQAAHQLAQERLSGPLESAQAARPADRARTHVAVYNAGAAAGSARALASQLLNLGYGSADAQNAPLPGDSRVAGEAGAASQVAADLERLGIHAKVQPAPISGVPEDDGAVQGAVDSSADHNPSGGEAEASADAVRVEVYLGAEAQVTQVEARMR